MKTGRSAAAAVGGIVALLMAVSPPAIAAQSGADDEAAPTSERIIRTVFPLTTSARLNTALEAISVAGVKVDGLRFENDQVVGELFLNNGKSPADFLKNFEATYGTEPQIVSAFIDEWREADAAEAARLVAGRAITISAPPFIAPPVSEEAAARLRSASMSGSPDAGASPLSTPPGPWVPQTVYPATFRAGTNSQVFLNYIEWGPDASPVDTPSNWAMEIEINLLNDATGVRGSVLPWELCGPAFRDQFIAKNYDWNSWSVYSYLGGVAASYPYADLNDLSDSCGRNAMSIGIAYPQNLPDHVLGADLTTNIDAQVGVTSSSRLSGNIGLVERWASCGPLTDPDTTNWTNCTGTYPATPPSPSDRSTLADWRNWTAAYDKCWISSDYGLVAPSTMSC